MAMQNMTVTWLQQSNPMAHATTRGIMFSPSAKVSPHPQWFLPIRTGPSMQSIDNLHRPISAENRVEFENKTLKSAQLAQTHLHKASNVRIRGILGELRCVFGFALGSSSGVINARIFSLAKK